MGDYKYKKSLRLFGCPYQFPQHVDPRFNDVSPEIGINYLNNIMTDSPVVTIIPGEPNYLAGESDEVKTTFSDALIKAAGGDFSQLQEIINNRKSDYKNLKYYDFKKTYSLYMQYVNVLCRACASFLELNTDSASQTIDGTPFTKYDWRNYQIDSKIYSGVQTSNKETNFFGKVGEAIDSYVEDKFNFQNNTVRFYVDPDVRVNENMNNSTTQSSVVGMVNSFGDMVKEMNFITNSTTGGSLINNDTVNGITSMVEGLFNKLVGEDNNNGIVRTLRQLLNIGQRVAYGENLIFPDIYNSSSYSKSYEFTVHLRAIYGCRLSYYLDILVPLMHILALGLPRQATANSYSSPFLIKMYAEGIFTCNMGIIDTITINKNSSSEVWNADGLSNEIDVTVSITDLYSDLSISSQSDPNMFLSNSSLIEYLATSCGLSLIAPNFKAKLDLSVNTRITSLTDIPSNVAAAIWETITNWVSNFVSLG